jgi:hypothetical protein
VKLSRPINLGSRKWRWDDFPDAEWLDMEKPVKLAEPLDQESVGTLIQILGARMRQDPFTDNPASIAWDYVEKTRDGSTWLRIEVLVRAGGTGNSNPIFCRELAKLLGETTKRA